MRAVIARILPLVLLVAACSSEPAVPQELALAETTTTAPTTTVAPTTTTSTTSTTTTIPEDPYRTWIATANEDVTWLTAYDEPDGEVIELPFLVPNPHQFGSELTLMVVDGTPYDEWVQVQLPIRPNEQVGWVRAENFTISETRVRAEVVLSESSVRVYDGEELIAETRAVVGKESTPTPLGTFYVAAKKENTEAEYYLGPNALVLSSFSEALETFSGGLPVIAIHGTHRPEQIGSHRSNGCIRVPNDVIAFLGEHVPIGAPVHISA